MTASMLYLPWVFLLGVCWGSFLHLCAVRIPKGLSIVLPPSHCPHCEVRLRAMDAIPLLGWLLIRGRCRSCATSVPIRYPLSELICGGLFVLIWGGYGLDWILLPYGVLLSILFVGSIVDLDEQWIPDRCSYGAMGLGLLFSMGYPELHGEMEWIAALVESAIGLVAGGGLLFLVGWVGSWVLKREAMGFGDVKLLAGIGAFLGWEAVLFSVFGGAVLGLLGTFLCMLMGKRERAEAIPFGPYLSLGALVWIVWGLDLWAFYLSIAFPEAAL
ncbi:MAG: prepilin peptidase [Kiritimatiellaceae bacterium]|nr:prepilin peptidase [Kiritimatiellaceae bacterium]